MCRASSLSLANSWYRGNCPWIFTTSQKRMDETAWFDDDDRMNVYTGITENLITLTSVWNTSGIFDD